MTTITVLYTCHGCGLTKVEVEVPVRPDTMDVVTWLQMVLGPPLAADHRRRSPLCVSDKHDLMIPHNDRPYVGGPKVN